MSNHLTADETLLCLDVSESIINTLASNQRARLCNDTSFIPSKTVLQVLQGMTKILDSQPSSALQSSSCAASMPNPVHDTPVPSPVVVAAPDDRGERTKKATKADNAEVPVYLWNDRIIPKAITQQQRALDSLRAFAFRWCKMNITKEFIRWFKAKHQCGPVQSPLLSEEGCRDLNA